MYTVETTALEILLFAYTIMSYIYIFQEISYTASWSEKFSKTEGLILCILAPLVMTILLISGFISMVRKLE